MRSLLIAPADEQRLAEALQSGADAILVDLTQAEPASAGRGPPRRSFSKRRAASVASRRSSSKPMRSILARSIWISTAIMAGAPDAILLPGSLGAAGVHQLSAKLAVREAKFSLEDGATRIIAVADRAQSLFSMGSYRGSSARLNGVAWSAESLRADIGAETDRDALGGALGPYRLARELTLLAATAAGVAAIDAIFPNARDLEGLRDEALAARRDGFAGKLAIDAAQAAIINEVFPPRSKG